MKIQSLVLLLMASLAFVLLGCSDNSAPIVAPTDEALSTSSSPAALAKGCVVVGSVVGDGVYSVSQSGANSGALVAAKVTFAAVKFNNGKCEDRYEMDYLDSRNKVTLRIKGTIEGIKFYGNVAMFWGKVKTEFYVDMFGPAKWRQIFVVTDNGKGKKAVPDRISNPWLTTDNVWPGEFDLFWGYSAETFCRRCRPTLA